MKGAEHYIRSEELLDLVDDRGRTPGGIPHRDADLFVAAAQVHATLALAAATAFADRSEWRKAGAT